MLRLRKFLCGWFGFLAALFVFVAFFTVRFAFKLFDTHRDLTVIGEYHGAWKIGAAALLILARVVLLIPLVLAVCYGMAWWSAKRGRPGLRGWAIAASVAMLLPCIPTGFFLAQDLIQGRRLLDAPFILLGFQLFFGVGGLAAFGGRDAAGDAELVKPKPPRMPGDGTSMVLDVAAWIVAGGGYLWLSYLWWKWAAAHQLPVENGLAFWALFFAASLVDSALHETGHATVGLALGMRLRAFVVGPLRWTVRDGRWRFEFQARNLLSLGGATGVIPVDPKQPKRADIAMLAAGPAASLATGVAAMAAAFAVNGTRFEGAWEFLALASMFGFISFVFNLFPLRPQALYSDGARIYQLLAGGVWADYHRVTNEATAGLVTAVRARDYDIDAIRRAEAGIAHGPQAVFLRLMAFTYYFDWGRTAEAGEAMREVERICRESPVLMTEQLRLWLVFAKAFVDGDAAGARTWWDRAEAAGVRNKDEMYWLAKSALAELEGNHAEAMASWNTGNALAQKLPRSGAYEFNRDCFARVRQAMERAAAQPVSLSTSQLVSE